MPTLCTTTDHYYMYMYMQPTAELAINSIMNTYRSTDNMTMIVNISDPPSYSNSRVLM